MTRHPESGAHSGAFIEEIDLALVARNLFHLYLFFARLRDQRAARRPPGPGPHPQRHDNQRRPGRSRHERYRP